MFFHCYHYSRMMPQVYTGILAPSENLIRKLIFKMVVIQHFQSLKHEINSGGCVGRASPATGRGKVIDKPGF